MKDERWVNYSKRGVTIRLYKRLNLTPKGANKRVRMR